jgi:N-succinyl-L-ornithine transcarbamylase
MLILSTKNWSSYKDYGKITNNDTKWTVTADKMKLTNHAKFMHCLPVRRNVVVTDEVIVEVELISYRTSITGLMPYSWSCKKYYAHEPQKGKLKKKSKK